MVEENEAPFDVNHIGIIYKKECVKSIRFKTKIVVKEMETSTLDETGNAKEIPK